MLHRPFFDSIGQCVPHQIQNERDNPGVTGLRIANPLGIHTQGFDTLIDMACRGWRVPSTPIEFDTRLRFKVECVVLMGDTCRATNMTGRQCVRYRILRACLVRMHGLRL